jgi:hypothetical protein
MCEVSSREKTGKNKPPQKSTMVNSKKMMSNEKRQPIQWIERPIGALVATSSL